MYQPHRRLYVLLPVGGLLLLIWYGLEFTARPDSGPKDEGGEHHAGISARLAQLYKPVRQNSMFLGKPLPPRTPNGSQFQLETDWAYYKEAVGNGGLNLSYLTEYDMEPYMADWEWEILRQPPLTDVLETGNETTSSIHVVGERPSYRVGDVVIVRVDICDGHGNQKTSGGDDVRVWAVDAANEASMTAEVTDLNNGSYSASFVLLWDGQVEIRARLAFNSEAIRAYFFLINVAKSTRNIMAGFETNFASESTMCSSFPWIPGYQRLCNLTLDNGGHPWYCGHPRNHQLDCRHWTVSFDLAAMRPLPLTPAESKLFRWINKREDSGRIRKPRDISLMVSRKYSSKRDELTGRSGTSNYSNPQRSIASWHDQSPTGHFFRGEWRRRSGIILPELTREAVSLCLRDTTVLILGDSNQRKLYLVLAGPLGCPAARMLENWHHPLVCTRNDSNTVVRWQIHAMPFHAGPTSRNLKGDHKGINQYIDEVPPTGKFVIAVHVYLHLVYHHFSVYVDKIKQMHDSIKRLLLRNPDVKVVIRGPHAVQKPFAAERGCDIMVHRFAETLRQQFADLQDRVAYLQTWDMTVATESPGYHTGPEATKNIGRLFLSYICE